MGNPRQYRNVRVSVQTKTESVDATWRTPNKSWAHTRWQRVALHPLSASEASDLDRQGRGADWRAVPYYARPVIVPGQRLLVYEDDATTVAMILDVIHVQERGRRPEVLCREISEVQS